MRKPVTYKEIEAGLATIEKGIANTEKAGNKFVLCQHLTQLDELFIALAQWSLRQKEDALVDFELSTIRARIEMVRWNTRVAAEKIHSSDILL